MRRPARKFGRLLFREYSVADPHDETLLEACGALHHALHPYDMASQPAAVTVEREHALRLKAAVEAWIHFGGHPADDATVAAQLVEVRRYARRCRR
jgi:hypothetical protein